MIIISENGIEKMPRWSPQCGCIKYVSCLYKEITFLKDLGHFVKSKYTEQIDLCCSQVNYSVPSVQWRMLSESVTNVM